MVVHINVRLCLYGDYQYVIIISTVDHICTMAISVPLLYQRSLISVRLLSVPHNHVSSRLYLYDYYQCLIIMSTVAHLYAELLLCHCS